MSFEEKYREHESLLTMLIAGHPESWSSNYKVLKRGAKILFGKSKKSKKSLGLTDPDLCSVSALLLGFAIECLIKGHLATDETFIDINGTLKKKFKTHNLRILVGYAKLDLSKEQLKILEFLTHCVEWRGRYPIPAKGKDIDSLLYLGFMDIYKAIESAFVVCDYIEKCCTPDTEGVV